MGRNPKTIFFEDEMLEHYTKLAILNNKKFSAFVVDVLKDYMGTPAQNTARALRQAQIIAEANGYDINNAIIEKKKE